MKSIFKDRYIISLVLFILFMLITIFQLVNLQIINGEEWYEKSSIKLYRTNEIYAPRGDIVDKNGVPLAVSGESYCVYYQKPYIKKEEFDDAMLYLTKIFNETGVETNNTFTRYLSIEPYTFNGISKETIINWQNNFEYLNIEEKNTIYNAKKIFEYLKNEHAFFKVSSEFSDKEAYDIMALKYYIQIRRFLYSEGEAICLAEDVPYKTVAMIQEGIHHIPGVQIYVQPKRKYTDLAYYAAQIVGYVTEENKNILTGITGIEFQTNKYLTGESGERRFETDLNGRVTNEISRDQAIPGSDVILTLDMTIQKAAIESLEKHIEIIRNKISNSNFNDAVAGAAVVINVKTGEILAMASYPTYDPECFIAKDNTSQKKRLELIFDEEGRPLLNRAIQSYYTPGSTFKPIVAIAALEEGIITADEVIECKGVEELGNMNFYCLEFTWGMGVHGPLILERALATSCNLYFHKIGVRTGIDFIDKWAKLFGLGEITGIDLPGEIAGIRANKTYKKEVYNEDWWIADTAQASIGQLYNSYTPLQLAVYTAAIANDGKRVTPYIIKQINSSEGTILYEGESNIIDIPISLETINDIKAGMKSVAQSVDGTAARVFMDFPIKVAGKTGTAETGKEAKYSSNALFICYAPADDPEIAVAVVVERGVWGSYIAPVAKDILSAYFKFDDNN